MNNTEQSLIAEAREGKTSALGAIYDQYAQRIYAYLYRRVGNRQVAEDLTGDVFVRMVQAADTPQFAATSLSGWLYRIAHNLMVDHLRKQRDDVLLTEDWSEPNADPHAITEGKLVQARLRTAINELTTDQQQVVLLRFGEGLRTREVAEIMGKQENAVWQLQHRALNSLRRILAGELNGYERRA